MAYPIEVQKIGSFAKHLLGQPGFHGIVLARVSGAIFLLGEQDEVIWITDSCSPMHIRNIQISTPLPDLAANTPFFTKDNTVQIGDSISLDVSSGLFWLSPRVEQVERVSVSRLNHKMMQFTPFLSIAPKPRGFGVFIGENFRILKENAYSDQRIFSDAILDRAASSIYEILLSLRSGRVDSVFEQFPSLIGLGLGLTPSGDDFLGGLLFTLHSLAAFYPEIIHLQQSKLKTFISLTKSQTNLISWTLLKDLSWGNGLEPVHLLVNQLFAEEPSQDLFDILCRLTAIGHSTGWDLLTGILVGLQVVSI
jgi:hypothetical protein